MPGQEPATGEAKTTFGFSCGNLFYQCTRNNESGFDKQSPTTRKHTLIANQAQHSPKRTHITGQDRLLKFFSRCRVNNGKAEKERL
jgi:hypothetical protein